MFCITTLYYNISHGMSARNRFLLELTVCDHMGAFNRDRTHTSTAPDTNWPLLYLDYISYCSKPNTNHNTVVIESEIHTLDILLLSIECL